MKIPIRQKETLDKLRKLTLNKKIIDVSIFNNGSFDVGIVLTLENEVQITGLDGEYGDNVLNIDDRQLNILKDSEIEVV